MSRRLIAWVRILTPAIVLGVLVWRLGTGPFLDGLRSVDGGSLAGAAGLLMLSTVCYAWRWKLVARGLGIDLPMRSAIPSYYRAVLLNTTLPSGIMGDVHRGVSHGRTVRDVGRGLRAVVWERFAGQVVQVLVTIIVLLALPSPVQGSMPWVALAVGLGTVCVAVLAIRDPGWSRSRWSRFRRAVAHDIREGVIARRTWPGIALTSTLGLAGHTGMFLLAAQAVGVTAPAWRVLPIALLVIASMSLPSLAGWGPREGVAAWAFGGAGLGAQRGVASAVVYGVMVLVATLPAATILVMTWFRGNRARRPGHPPLGGEAARA